MQVECVRAFGTSVPGDLAEVPDGAAVDPAHWRPVQPATPAPPEAAVITDGHAEGAAPEEGM